MVFLTKGKLLDDFDGVPLNWRKKSDEFEDVVRAMVRRTLIADVRWESHGISIDCVVKQVPWHAPSLFRSSSTYLPLNFLLGSFRRYPTSFFFLLELVRLRAEPPLSPDIVSFHWKLCCLLLQGRHLRVRQRGVSNMLFCLFLLLAIGRSFEVKKKLNEIFRKRRIVLWC